MMQSGSDSRSAGASARIPGMAKDPAADVLFEEPEGEFGGQGSRWKVQGLPPLRPDAVVSPATFPRRLAPRGPPRPLHRRPGDQRPHRHRPDRRAKTRGSLVVTDQPRM